MGEISVRPVTTSIVYFVTYFTSCHPNVESLAAVYTRIKCSRHEPTELNCSSTRSSPPISFVGQIVLVNFGQHWFEIQLYSVPSKLETITSPGNSIHSEVHLIFFRKFIQQFLYHGMVHYTPVWTKCLVVSTTTSTFAHLCKYGIVSELAKSWRRCYMLAQTCVCTFIALWCCSPLYGWFLFSAIWSVCGESYLPPNLGKCWKHSSYALHWMSLVRAHVEANSNAPKQTLRNYFVKWRRRKVFKYLPLLKIRCQSKTINNLIPSGELAIEPSIWLSSTFCLSVRPITADVSRCNDVKTTIRLVL